MLLHDSPASTWYSQVPTILEKAEESLFIDRTFLSAHRSFTKSLAPTSWSNARHSHRFTHFYLTSSGRELWCSWKMPWWPLVSIFHPLLWLVFLSWKSVSRRSLLTSSRQHIEDATITSCKLFGGRSRVLVLHNVICHRTRFIKKMAAISFCPLSFVKTAWLDVQQEAPQIPHVDDLVLYFNSTWMNGQFKHHQWNYFNFKGPRTNNHVEGWHSRLKKVVSIYKPHSNIYEIIDVFKRKEANTKMKMQMLEAGAQQAPRWRRVRQKERRIQNLFARFSSGAMSLNDYLEAMKYNTGLWLDFI